MVKYLINENIHGYERITVKDTEATNNKDNLFVIILDKSCDNDTGNYYKLISNALKNNNRVILVSVDDENKSFRPLASLMTTFNNYDIYQVQDKESISAPYLLKLEDRKPDLTEVQTFIGGDITAYSDMNTILFGIESLVDEGNDKGLKEFVEKHLISIENLTSTLNNMKKTCDTFNSNELIDAVNALKDKESKLKTTIDEKEKEISTIKFDRDTYKVESENLKRENTKLKNKNMDLESQAEAGVSVIRTYKEINTASINCKTKLVLYFKEISYVQYVNSLVDQLINIMETMKLKTKLLVYDSQSELYSMYKPMPVVTGSDYVSMKGNLISKTKKFVVAEPNPTILQDILLSEQCFDVVIIYDRMRSIHDVVTGNNVTKFFVINSSKEFDELKQALKISDTSYIITHSSSTIGKDKSDRSKENVASKTRQFLDIPTIDGYSSLTPSAKTSKYMKIATAFTKVPLIDTILKKSRVDTLKK